MNKSDVYNTLNSSVAAYEGGDFYEAKLSLANLMNHDVRTIVGQTHYDIAMEIYVFVFSGDLTKEGRTGGYISIAECRKAIDLLRCNSEGV